VLLDGGVVLGAIDGVGVTVGLGFLLCEGAAFGWRDAGTDASAKLKSLALGWLIAGAVVDKMAARGAVAELLLPLLDSGVLTAPVPTATPAATSAAVNPTDIVTREDTAIRRPCAGRWR
jgi:hypothetical protein